MMPRVYVETTIVSYLTAWPSRDIIMAGHQQVTRDWWNTQRDRFELFASQLVIQEASRGDAEAARNRLAVLDTMTLLEISEADFNLAEALVREGALPKTAAEDALHIAIAATNGIDFLLTWNCRHLANAVMRNQIEQVCRVSGYEPPAICTPDLLREDETDV